MKEPSVKIQMMMAAQGKANFMNALLAGPLAVFATMSYLELGMTIEGVLGSMVLSWIIFKVLCFITFNILRISIYGLGKREILADTQDAANYFQSRANSPMPIADRFELTVVNTPEKPIGIFQEHPIFEWIDLQGDDDKHHRFVFISTMNIEHGLSEPIPPHCILLPPGLVYQDEESINKPT